MTDVRSSEALQPPRRTGLLSGWFVRHTSTAIAALGRIWRQPFASLMTILVIAVTLALPAAMHVVVKNARSISASWDNALDFSVYLTTSTSLEQATRLADIIGQRADIESVQLVSAEDALTEFR